MGRAGDPDPPRNGEGDHAKHGGGGVPRTLRFVESPLHQPAAGPPPREAGRISGREDLRHLPIVAIDPADARDHDDAVAAHVEEDGGATIWVAIADVAAYYSQQNQASAAR